MFSFTEESHNVQYVVSHLLFLGLTNIYVTGVGVRVWSNAGCTKVIGPGVVFIKKWALRPRSTSYWTLWYTNCSFPLKFKNKSKSNSCWNEALHVFKNHFMLTWSGSWNEPEPLLEWWCHLVFKKLTTTAEAGYLPVLVLKVHISHGTSGGNWEIQDGCLQTAV